VAVRESLGFPLSVAALTDVGRVRSNNEDAYGKCWLPDESLLVVVCDGMGGHEAGEVASGLAVRVVEEVMTQDLESDPRERIYNALLEANAAILDEGSRSGTSGMGTTSIIAHIHGQTVHLGLIGDSRLFHIRRGRLLWRTLDHTRVQMLVDEGMITDEESRTHPEAGMLTRALGHSKMADGRALEPDVLLEPLHIEEHDTLVLSSDGLHDLLFDWEIAQAVAGRTSEDAAAYLVKLACDRGGHDNVTVAVVNAGPRAGEYDPDYVPDWELANNYTEEAPPPPPPPPEPKGSNTGMIIAGVVGLLLVLLVGAAVVAAVVYSYM